ncbi:MAG: hypothetical protein O3A29_15080 [Planctomycetota bacterium]|nr:hypothetical protein [Planctomycetota bacterium]
MRTAMTFIAVFSTAVLISEGVGLAVLWSRGKLNSELLNGVYELVMHPKELEESEVALNKPAAPSLDDISTKRVSRILELNSRESELSQIEQFLLEKRNELTRQQNEFEKKQNEFRNELAELIAQFDADSTKKTRNVLVTLSPSDAVTNLMEMTLEQDLILVKGMPKDKMGKS